MTYSLAEFCEDCHSALKTDPGPDGREVVRRNLEQLLSNADFVAKTCGPDAERGTHTLYKDPELGFQVLAHINEKGVQSPPHDHGPSWAVYGQAVKATDMTVWRRTDDGSKEGQATVEPKDKFRLEPGMAGTFNPGDIHSIDFPDGARFVRVTGTDLNTIGQNRYNLKENSVSKTEPVVGDQQESKWSA